MMETLGLILMGGSAILWRMGGMGMPPLGKAWRRYFLPLILGVIALLRHLPPLSIVGAVLGSVVAFSLPYGERTPYWVKFLVGIAFVAPTLLLGITLWQIIVPIVFLALFKLSNSESTANEFGWGIVELIVGLGIGICWARVLGLA